jgi:hypothetical protein
MRKILGSASILVLCASPVLAQTPQTYAASSAATVNTTSGLLFSAGAFQRFLQICTLPGSTGNVWLNLAGGTAVVSQGTIVYANGGCTTFSGGGPLPVPKSQVNAITDGGSAQSVAYAGG